jgi:hypothetical protein
MSRGIKDKLDGLRRALFGGRSGTDKQDTSAKNKIVLPTDARQPRRRNSRIDAHLGIDFGTRFTKVVMQLPHLGTSVPLVLGGEAKTLYPSRIAVRKGIAYPPDLPAPRGATWVEYLKMRLTNGGEAAFGDGSMSHTEIAALCAHYIAGVLRLAQASAHSAGALPSGSEVRWFAQVGVPTKTYDSSDLGIFEQVCAVAWAWKDDAPMARSITDLIASYSTALATRPSREDSPIQVAPELVAAISHIASRSDAPEGLYAFIDIGGGTLDGTVFALRRTPRVAVNILSAHVDPLGTVAVARQIAGKSGSFEAAEQKLIVGQLTKSERSKLTHMEVAVGRLLHKIVAEAVMKTPSSEFVSLVQSDLDRRMHSNTYRTVPVMLAGGGSSSVWYTGVFKQLDMRQRAIGEFKVRVVPRPGGSLEDEYHRFVVARGLSNRDLQIRNEYQLPSHIPNAPPPPPRELNIFSPVSKDAV